MLICKNFSANCFIRTKNVQSLFLLFRFAPAPQLFLIFFEEFPIAVGSQSGLSRPGIRRVHSEVPPCLIEYFRDSFYRRISQLRKV